MAKITLTIRYDKESDMAYIYLAPIADSEITETVTYDEMPAGILGDANLDFNKQGILKGLEISNASKILPPELLSQL